MATGAPPKNANHYGENQKGNSMKTTLGFTYDGRSLEARADIQPKGVKVQVFEGGKRVTNKAYSATMDTVLDAQKYPHFQNFVQSMLEMAKADIENGIVTLDRK